VQMFSAMFAEPGIRCEATALGTNDLFSHLRTQDTIKGIRCQWGVWIAFANAIINPLCPPVLGEVETGGYPQIPGKGAMPLCTPVAEGRLCNPPVSPSLSESGTGLERGGGRMVKELFCVFSVDMSLIN
jgi:hypothetical protein